MVEQEKTEKMEHGEHLCTRKSKYYIKMISDGN